MRKRHFKLIIILIFSLTQLTFAGSKPPTKELKNEILGRVDEKSQLLVEVSDALWEYDERVSSRYISTRVDSNTACDCRHDSLICRLNSGNNVGPLRFCVNVLCCE